MEENNKKINGSDLVTKDGKLTLLGAFTLIAIWVSACNYFVKTYVDNDNRKD